MINQFRQIGPALIVAAVVLGPGSILTSTRVGMQFGYAGVPVVLVTTILMIGMVALAAQIGAYYPDSPCDQLARRLGRPVTIAIGLVLFAIVAVFQYSNNIALLAGLGPLLEQHPDTTRPLMAWHWIPASILVLFNAFVIACLFQLQHLYKKVEHLMKILVGFMILAFLVNFVIVLGIPPSANGTPGTTSRDWVGLLGLVGTTFSIAGAFYQAYLVKEKGWGVEETRRGLLDSILSISILGGLTIIILITAVRVFHGSTPPVSFNDVGDVARQLEPLFGSWAKLVFSLGIIAGALSSFLVNALVGGTVLADALGLGCRLQDRSTQVATSAALLCGLIIALCNLGEGGGTVSLITFAQALTVLGLPALAATLLYLGTRKELTKERRIPGWILSLGTCGFFLSVFVAWRMAAIVLDKLTPFE